MNDQFIPQGALIVTDFDPSKGSEINKRRPALVISRNEYNRAGNLLMVCPITTTTKERPYLVPIDHPQLAKNSKVNTSQIYTIDYTQAGNRKVKCIGKLNTKDFLMIGQCVLLNFNF